MAPGPRADLAKAASTIDSSPSTVLPPPAATVRPAPKAARLGGAGSPGASNQVAEGPYPPGGRADPARPVGVGGLHEEEVHVSGTAQRPPHRPASNERGEIRPFTIATRTPRRWASWIRLGQISSPL